MLAATQYVNGPAIAPSVNAERRGRSRSQREAGGPASSQTGPTAHAIHSGTEKADAGGRPRRSAIRLCSSNVSDEHAGAEHERQPAHEPCAGRGRTASGSPTTATSTASAVHPVDARRCRRTTPRRSRAKLTRCCASQDRVSSVERLGERQLHVADRTLLETAFAIGRNRTPTCGGRIRRSPSRLISIGVLEERLAPLASASSRSAA